MFSNLSIWGAMLWGVSVAACGGVFIYDGVVSIISGVKYANSENRVLYVSIFWSSILAAAGISVSMVGVAVFTLAIWELLKI